MLHFLKPVILVKPTQRKPKEEFLSSKQRYSSLNTELSIAYSKYNLNLFSELSNYIHHFMNSFIGSFIGSCMGSSVEYFVGYIHCKIRKNPAFSIKTDFKKSNKKPRFQAVIGLIPRFFNSCGRWDLNPHVLSDTRSLVLPVCHSSTPAQQRKFYHNFLYCASFFLVETKSFLRKRKVYTCFIPANKCFGLAFLQIRLPVSLLCFFLFLSSSPTGLFRTC